MSRRASDWPRRGRRNRLLLCGLIPSLLVVTSAVGIAAVVHRNESGRTAYAVSEYADARAAFGTNARVMPGERWVAEFNSGAALFAEGTYGAALKRFLSALDVAPAVQECRIRLNIAVTSEMLGDEERASALTQAVARWRAARAALAAGRCVSPAVGSDPSAGGADGGRVTPASSPLLSRPMALPMMPRIPRLAEPPRRPLTLCHPVRRRRIRWSRRRTRR